MKTYDVVFANCTVVFQVEAKSKAEAKKKAIKALESGEDSGDVVQYKPNEITVIEDKMFEEEK